MRTGEIASGVPRAHYCRCKLARLRYVELGLIFVPIKPGTGGSEGEGQVPLLRLCDYDPRKADARCGRTRERWTRGSRLAG